MSITAAPLGVATEKPVLRAVLAASSTCRVIVAGPVPHDPPTMRSHDIAGAAAVHVHAVLAGMTERLKVPPNFVARMLAGRVGATHSEGVGAGGAGGGGNPFCAIAAARSKRGKVRQLPWSFA
jgi:hypothetical protein